MSSKNDRRNASRTPTEANMNTLEHDGFIFMEMPAPLRKGDSHNIGAIVVVVMERSRALVAIAEVDLPCDGDHPLTWVAHRDGPAPSEDKLGRLNAGVRMLLDGVRRRDRGRRVH